MPYAAYGGACFKCNRKGVTLTAAGKRAQAKVNAWKAEQYTYAASQVPVGHRILDTMRGRWVTVTEVTTTLGKGNGVSRSGVEGTASYTEVWTYGTTTISTKGCGHSGAAHRAVIALPPVEEYREALHAYVRSLRPTKGMTLA